MRLTNKIVVVTASTRGIGWEIVRRCAEEGAVVYMAVRNVEKGEQQARSLCEQGYHVAALHLDSKDESGYAKLAQELLRREGRVDVLVNNFGTGNPEKDLDLTRTDFETVMDLLRTNLASVYLSSQALFPAMEQQGSGSIVNVSSIGGVYPELVRVGYGLSKSAVNFLTQSVAVRGGRSGVRCNAVLPGMIATDSVAQNLPPEFEALFQRHTPIPRMGKPQEIADAVVYFASDESTFTTGQLLEVSGGFGLPSPLYGESAPAPKAE